MRALFAAVVVLAPWGAWADTGITYTDAPTMQCLHEAPFDAVLDCVGRAANTCQEETPGASSTVVMTACFEQELRWWDARLNQTYRDLRSAALETDMGAAPNDPSQAAALRDMQTAWIAFRDATCGYEASLWAGGTGASPAFMACLLRVTAEQAVYLSRVGLE